MARPKKQKDLPEGVEDVVEELHEETEATIDVSEVAEVPAEAETPVAEKPVASKELVEVNTPKKVKVTKKRTIIT